MASKPPTVQDIIDQMVDAKTTDEDGGASGQAKPIPPASILGHSINKQFLLVGLSPDEFMKKHGPVDNEPRPHVCPMAPQKKSESGYVLVGMTPREFVEKHGTVENEQEQHDDGLETKKMKQSDQEQHDVGLETKKMKQSD